MFQCLWQLDLCLTISYLVAGTSVATESTECTVVELSIPIMTDPVESLVDDMAEDIYDEDEEAETEAANSSTEFSTLLKATGSDPTTPVSQLKKRKVSQQDIQKMQLDVLNVEKVKTGLEVENLKLINTKLKLELEELKARKQSPNFVEY